MTRRTGRTAIWSDWADNRPPVENTERREKQLRDQAQLRELDKDLKRRESA